MHFAAAVHGRVFAEVEDAHLQMLHLYTYAMHFTDVHGRGFAEIEDTDVQNARTCILTRLLLQTFMDMFSLKSKTRTCIMRALVYLRDEFYECSWTCLRRHRRRGRA